MQEIYRALARLMGTDLTVMITGESGTGKELVARALHDFGKRRNGPFVAINMAAIPRELIESELFGHEKGAFTGATARSMGRFEQAQGGTLFLDEIGDMPIDAQTRLLRVLQEGEFTAVGGRVPIRADVRIVAATHHDLRQLIRQGLFREDLFYRLNVAPIRLPPLRERNGGHPGARAAFRRARGARRLADEAARRGGDGAAARLSLAGQCARAGEPGAAARAPCIRRRSSASRSSRPSSPTHLAAGGPGRGGGRRRARCRGRTPHQGLLRGPQGRSAGRRALRSSAARDRAAADRRDASAPPAATRSGRRILLGLNRNTLRKKIRELDIPVVRGLK